MKWVDPSDQVASHGGWYDPGFTTDEMNVIFSPAAYVAALTSFEGALARAQADLELIPSAAADQIATACAVPIEDAPALLAAGWRAGTPLLPLLEILSQRVEPDAAQWLHHGATTQDAVDTARMVQARQALAVLESRVRWLGGELGRRSEAHAHDLVVGRTFDRPAVTTTIGVRFAGWLTSATEVLAGLQAARTELTVQLGGPIGDRAQAGELGSQLTERVAERLGLSGALPWHTARQGVVRLLTTVAASATAIEKIATDLSFLAIPELGEVSVPAGGSSSIEGKANPVDLMRAAAAGRICRHAAAIVLTAPPLRMERDFGWHAEGFALPVAFSAADATIAAVNHAVSELVVDRGRAADNATRFGHPAFQPEIGSHLIDDAIRRWQELAGRSG